jgi:hypothetical protein
MQRRPKFFRNFYFPVNGNSPKGLTDEELEETPYYDLNGYSIVSSKFPDVPDSIYVAQRTQGTGAFNQLASEVFNRLCDEPPDQPIKLYGDAYFVLAGPVELTVAELLEIGVKMN